MSLTIKKEYRYPIYCPKCKANINGHADWDKSCCNSCANYEEKTDNKEAKP